MMQDSKQRDRERTQGIPTYKDPQTCNTVSDKITKM